MNTALDKDHRSKPSPPASPSSATTWKSLRKHAAESSSHCRFNPTTSPNPSSCGHKARFGAQPVPTTPALSNETFVIS